MGDAPKYELIGQLLYGVQRFGGVERLRALADDGATQPALAACAGELAERHDRLMKWIEEGRALEAPEVDALLGRVPALLQRVAAE